MHKRDFNDALGGALLVAFGLFMGFHAVGNYPLGSIYRMGPGMFPAALAFLLAGIGLAIVIPSLLRPRLAGGSLQLELRPFASIVGAMALFALLVGPLGLVPAVAALTACATLAKGQLRPMGILVLAAILSAAAVLIFRVLLGIPMPLFGWPF